MKILIAPDSFKDALPAEEVAAAIGRGLRNASAKFVLVEMPMADGGEGTARAVSNSPGAEWVETRTVDALLRPVRAGFVWFPEKKMALIELAEATGLQKLVMEERNPLNTSTFGAGLQIKHAIEMGATEILLALGGSSTNDAGAGFAAALGYRFFAENEEVNHPSGKDLSRITSIDSSAAAYLTSVKFTALCDVDNPLLGPRGSASIYAPQKGADAQMVAALEKGVDRFSNLVESVLQISARNIAGAGAAGGCGFGAMAFLNAKLQPGATTILEMLEFEESLSTCDWLITGEGSIDRQTVSGKLLATQGGLARKHKVPAIAFCGRADISSQELETLGITAVFPLGNGVRNLPEALAATASDLERLGLQVGRMIRAKSGD
jgi:glycerate kinase